MERRPEFRARASLSHLCCACAPRARCAPLPAVFPTYPRVYTVLLLLLLPRPLLALDLSRRALELGMNAEEVRGLREPPALPTDRPRAQTPPRGNQRPSQSASAIELRPIVAGEGAEPQVVTATEVDPQAAGEPVPIVQAAPLQRSDSTLFRTASATLMARPVVTTHNNVPMLSCRCPRADDLPCDTRTTEKCVTGICGTLAYLFYGALVVFASWSATKLTLSIEWYDPTGVVSALVTLGIVLGLACACAGLASVSGDDAAAPCCFGLSALAVLSGLLCFAVTPPLAENWYMSEGASPVRFVDPELAAGERSVYTGKDADLVASSFAGRLSEYTSGSSEGVFDAPVDIDASRTINTQDDYQEIEFALSSYVDTSLSVPIFFDDKDDIELDQDPETVRIPQLCVAPVLRTCDVLPGGAPWRDVFRGGALTRTGVAPLDSSGLPSANPSINQAYCDARRRDAQQPCSFWDAGLNCSAGASEPVELWVNFFMYVKVEQAAKTANLRETCARTWQWAFEKSTIEGGDRATEPSAFKADPEDADSKEVWYPQPETMGTPTDPGIFKLPEGMESDMQRTARLFGNPAPLAGHSTCTPLLHYGELRTVEQLPLVAYVAQQL